MKKNSRKKYKRIEKEIFKEEWIDILDFYLFNCPVVFKKNEYDKTKAKRTITIKVSQKSKTFEDRKITGISLTNLLQQMRNDNKYSITFSDKPLLKEELEETNSIEIIENKEIGKTRSVYYMLRNAIAHCDFKIEKDCFIGFCEKDKKIKAKINLSKSCLLYWLALVNNFELKKRQNKMSPVIHKEITKIKEYNK